MATAVRPTAAPPPSHRIPTVLETVASRRPFYDRAAVFDPVEVPRLSLAGQPQRAQERGNLLQSESLAAARARSKASSAFRGTIRAPTTAHVRSHDVAARRGATALQKAPLILLRTASRARYCPPASAYWRRPQRVKVAKWPRG